MYCCHCGVKLAENQKVCPLCQTPAYHPNIARMPAVPEYSRIAPPRHRRSKVGAVVLLAVFLAVALLTLNADRSLSWWGYVAGALAVCYVAVGLPAWFTKPNPVIFTPCTMVAALFYLWYIDRCTPGTWFFLFALPVGMCLILTVTAVVTLLYYLHAGQLYIIGGGLVALGGICPMAEALLCSACAIPFLGWSVFPLVVLAAVGGFCIFLAINTGARQAAERKFFI